ncbi:hypothetical protein [Sediminibacterium soli]|uniref:hypothetical protein n=1 Tax=Sediminibacterium soli TaxID=2698829 RepID=UPI00137AA5ED|nr:hypothetical protein [Sediminibacterium soli]NCI45692.1 hypothetical protein [Sediminibacterium soli]
MKQFYLWMFALVFPFAILSGQSRVHVPQVVTSSFSLKYPTIDKVKVSWLQDGDGSYAARFYQRGEPCTVRYSAGGRWLDGVRKMTFGDLRNNVRDAFSQGPFASWQAFEVNEILLPDKEPRYRILIRHAETQTEKYLLYDSKGKLLRGKGI